MSANLTTYYWAEQTNRERLTAQAERGWLAEEAAALRRSPSRAAMLRRATGTLLVRLGTHLHGVGSVSPLPTPEGARSQA